MIKLFKRRERVKFTTKTDGNIPYGIVGVVIEKEIDGHVEVRFKEIGTWGVCYHELRRIPKRKKK